MVLSVPLIRPRIVLQIYILHLTRNILFQYCSCNVQQYQNAHTVHRGLCCTCMNQGVQGKCTATLTTRTHDTPLTRQSALLFLQSYQGSSTGRALSLQHNTTHYCTNISEVVVQRAMSEGVPQETGVSSEQMLGLHSCNINHHCGQGRSRWSGFHRTTFQ